MSVIKWPQAPESDHPQYLWNEHEYVIRMLTQNKIGLGLEETNNEVILYATPDKSMCMVSHGPSEYTFPDADPSYPFPIDLKNKTPRWVYCRASKPYLYDSEERPVYNTILQGWYHPDPNIGCNERAVLFIDPYKPIGFRGMIMDSPNSMFDYDNYIPDDDKGEDMLQDRPLQPGEKRKVPLKPGKYRFEVKGGDGGNGGRNRGSSPTGTDYDLIQKWFSALGGQGGEAPEEKFKLILDREASFWIQRGADGEDGGAVSRKVDTGGEVHPETPSRLDYVAAGAGGGSSGQDSYMQIADGAYTGEYLVRSYGGAGGGGAFACLDQKPNTGDSITVGGEAIPVTYFFTGPGGGGAGSGSAENGGLKGWPASEVDAEKYRGKAGNAQNGGFGGEGYFSHSGGNHPGGQGQGFTDANGNYRDRRNGGNGGYVSSISSLPIPEGGKGIKKDSGNIVSHGYVKIFRYPLI